MNIGITLGAKDFMPNVHAEFYNDKLNETLELAEVESCLDIMNRYVEQLDTLRIINALYESKKFSDVAVESLKAIVPSVEVSIFSIGGAIIKALYNVCKWVLGVIGKVWRWFFSFFKRSIKDTRKKIEGISELVPLAQNETVGRAISYNAIKLYSGIFNAHMAGRDTDPNPQVGMKIEDYKNLWFQTFNNKVPANARVTNKGDLSVSINRGGTGKLSMLGWSTADKLLEACEMITKDEAEFEGILKSLRDQSKDIKQIVNQCENSGYVANKFIEEKGPDALNAACLVTVVVKDIKLLKSIEDNFGAMVDNIEKVAKKYVASRTTP